MKRIILCAALLALAGCSNSNLDYVRKHGEQRWKDIGFDVVGYQGHQWCGGGFGTNYGGACVWWELRKTPDNGITYSGYLRRWGDSLEIYGPIARDAIKP